MSLREDYLYWTIAQHFIVDKKYRIIHITQDQTELWLENIRDKQIPIIRLKRMNIDWSNWLRRDIEITGKNGIRIKKVFYKRNLDVMNVYVSSFPPVDSYQDLINDTHHLEKEKIAVRSVLLTGTQIHQTAQTILESLGINLDQLKDEYEPYEIETLKKHVLELALLEVKKEKQLLHSGKPFFTYVFLAIQILIFLLMELRGGSTNPFVLIEFGAKFNPFILEGEWWRLITPMFLHIGMLHLLMNSLALYYLGTAVEKIFGKGRFLFIYLFAGFFGAVASFIFSPNIAAGASGAIFGCFGALLYFGLMYRETFWRTMGMNIVVVLILNLVMGFTLPSIDNAGHIGGLVGGFLASGIVHLPKSKKLGQQVILIVVTLVITLTALYIGFKFPNI